MTTLGHSRPASGDLSKLEHDIGRALDRNGLRESGWSDREIETAMMVTDTVSPFSQGEAKIVMTVVGPYIAAIRPMKP